MKLIFDSDEEKKALVHIVSEWLVYCDANDILGCDPCCRNEASPGCDSCIREIVEEDMGIGIFDFDNFGGADWILQHTIQPEH